MILQDQGLQQFYQSYLSSIKGLVQCLIYLYAFLVSTKFFQLFLR